MERGSNFCERIDTKHAQSSMTRIQLRELNERSVRRLIERARYITSTSSFRKKRKRLIITRNDFDLVRQNVDEACSGGEEVSGARGIRRDD